MRASTSLVKQTLSQRLFCRKANSHDDADTYQRGGIYKIETPAVLGNETAGTVVQLGEKVQPSVFGFDVGDRVAVRFL